MSEAESIRFRLQTIHKFFILYNIAVTRGRSLTAREISEEIVCSIRHAYNYKRPLDALLRSLLII